MIHAHGATKKLSLEKKKRVIKERFRYEGTYVYVRQILLL